MLTLIIISTIFLIGVPILLINSLIKSEEKQLDLLLYNLGGSSAVEERVRKNKRAVKVKREVASKPATKPATKPVVAAVKATQKPQAKPKQTSKVTKRVPVTKMAPTKTTKTIPKEQPIELAFHLKMVIFYDTAKENISQKILSLRKKMPGYVYPSRQEMLLDQQAKENVPSSK